VVVDDWFVKCVHTVEREFQMISAATLLSISLDPLNILRYSGTNLSVLGNTHPNEVMGVAV